MSTDLILPNSARAAEIDELRVLMRRMEALLGPEVEPRVPVDPDGTPGNVATGELIESAWGNAVVNNIDALYRGLPSTTAPYVGGYPANTSWPTMARLMRAGRAQVATSGFGDATVNFPTAFANGVISVVAMSSGNLSGGVAWWPSLESVSNAGFTFWAMSYNGAQFATGHPPNQPNVYTVVGTVTLDYIAFGV